MVKDLMGDLEKGNRVKEHLKKSFATKEKPQEKTITIDVTEIDRLRYEMERYRAEAERHHYQERHEYERRMHEEEMRRRQYMPTPMFRPEPYEY